MKKLEANEQMKVTAELNRQKGTTPENEVFEAQKCRKRAKRKRCRKAENDVPMPAESLSQRVVIVSIGWRECSKDLRRKAQENLDTRSLWFRARKDRISSIWAVRRVNKQGRSHRHAGKTSRFVHVSRTGASAWCHGVRYGHRRSCHIEVCRQTDPEK